MKNQINFDGLGVSISDLLDLMAKSKESISDYQNKRVRLLEIKDKINSYKRKFENNEMEIAFVGREKAGKSSLINAFIGINILPSATERATYTTTTLRYNTDDYVLVKFYTEKEFNEQVLIPILRLLNYPDYALQEITTLYTQTIEEHFNRLKNDTKSSFEHLITTVGKDLIEISEGKKEIEFYLNKEDQRIGINDEKLRDFITNKYISRAVKEVIIFSSKLIGLENAVIYDLPGFDSPTFSHSDFTIKKIKQSDAVVLVREADKPSLTQPEVEVITKTFEDDGIKLQDKIFLFLNKSDVLRTKQRLEEIKIKIQKELIDNNIFIENRIYFGSSLAKLYELNQIYEDEIKFASSVYNDAKELDILNSIEFLKENLINYNQNERRNILNKRLMGFLNEIKNLIHILESEIQSNLKEDNIYKKRTKILLEKSKQYPYEIEKKLSAKLSHLKNEIPEQQIITKMLKESIRNDIKMPDIELVEELIKQVEREYSTVGQRPEKFNFLIREEITTKIRLLINSKIENSLKETITKIKNEILDILLEVFSPPEHKKNEILSYIKDYLDKQLSDFEIHPTSLRFMVDRFFGDTIEFIKIPLSSIDRLNKFNEVKKHLFALCVFSKDYNEKLSLDQQPLIFKFFQIDLHSVLTNIINITNIEISSVDELIKVLDPTINPYLFESLLLLNNTTNYLKQKIKLEQLEELYYNLKFKSDKLDISSYIKNKVITPSNYDEVIVEVEKDIQFLKEFFEDAILTAISIEKALIIQITEYINGLLSFINDKEKPIDFFTEILESCVTEFDDLEKTRIKNEYLKQTLIRLDEIQHQLNLYI